MNNRYSLCVGFLLVALAALACDAPPSPTLLLPTPTTERHTKEPSPTPLPPTPTTERHTKGSSDLVGKWRDQAPPFGFGATITIYRSPSGYDMNWEFPDGSSIKKTLVETTISGKKALLDPSTEQYQEYYVIDSQGNLGMYDSEGLISTAKSTN